jgi:hypothetical protein
MNRHRNRIVAALALVAAAYACDSGRGTDSLYDLGGGGCVQCHNASVAPGMDPLLTNGSGTAGKHVKHVQNRGIACETCHNGYYPLVTHMNGTFDTGNPAVGIVLFDSSNSAGTWTNDTGPGTGSCASVACHGGFQLDWYGAGLPSCAACHSAAMGSRRQVMGAGGDFGANPARLSHHITGTADPTPAQCEVCHDMSQHMAGTVRLRNADTGAAIAYNASTPNTLEPFCLSCHDADGTQTTYITSGSPSSPFDDGSALGQVPYRAGIDISDSWQKAYGHRLKGLTCLGAGTPGTGCHANGHGAPAIGILAKNLQIPQPERYRESDFAICLECHQSYPSVSKEVIFGIKFTEVVSGVTLTHRYDWGYGPLQDPPLRSDPIDVYSPPYNLSGGIQTHFRDQNYDGATGKFYDDPTYFFGDFFNLHCCISVSSRGSIGARRRGPASAAQPVTVFMARTPSRVWSMIKCSMRSIQRAAILMERCWVVSTA